MICGIDEAGRGSVLGPLVIAAVLIKNDEQLIKLGVKDSKKLTPNQREKLTIAIKKICKYKTLMISPKEIDEKRKVMTLNELEVDKFAEIIKELKPNIVYVDSVDVNEERFAEEIKKKLDFKVKIISKHKADEVFPVVSSASIIAKTTRDEEIKKIKKEFGEIGSGYPSDERTINFIENYLKEKRELPKFVRSSWDTIKRLIESKRRKFYFINLFSSF